MKRGLFIGRFQPFHIGHLHIIKTVLQEVDELVIGIGYSKEKNTEMNPFSVEERIEMIESVLQKIGNKYTLYPIPDHPNDSKWMEQIEVLVPKFNIVFMSDKNTYAEKWVEKCFEKKYKIKKIKALMGIDATEIRSRIKNKKDWKSLVPDEIKEYIEKLIVRE